MHLGRSRFAFWSLLVAVLLPLTSCSVDRSTNLKPGTGANPSTSPPQPAPPGAAPDDPPAKPGPQDPAPVADGETCDADNQCKSGHCDHGLCCSGGTCCKVDTDCGGEGEATCEDPAECQGARGTVACLKNRCRVQAGEDDDSGCDDTAEADDCGFYKSVMCNGRASQRAPQCPTSCGDDDDCDSNARCRDEECIAAEPNGGTCEVASDCASRHCSNGVCCESGDCCSEDRDCASMGMSAPPRCTDPTTCQGSREGPTCVESMCRMGTIDDDSACTLRTMAQDCPGAAPDVYCTGAENQRAARDCDSNCRWDPDCPPEQHCADFTCIDDLPNGQACDRASACDSNYCAGSFGQPRFCCEQGACCQTDENCIGRYVCDDRADCQGRRFEQACNEAFTCEDVEDGEIESNDSGCVGQVASTCGSNRDALCTLAPSQSRPFCAGGGSGRCSGGGDCDPWLECRDGYCQSPESSED